jgi:hypothetical protein
MTYAQKRAEIKRILGLLDEANRTVFKRMYSSLDQDRDINLVVDEMSWQHLDWALSQCETSYHRIFAILRRAE